MVASEPRQLVISLDTLTLTEQYLLSIATGIPLSKEYRGYFQKYIDEVIEITHGMGIESYGRVKGIVLGASLEIALKVRNMAFNKIAAGNNKFNDIKLMREHAYHDDIDLLFANYKEVLAEINPLKQTIFEELSREWFCVHGAMMLKGAKGLRKFHLDTERLDEKLIVDHFTEGLNKFKVDEFA
ncbi:hypothetical protein COV81_03370 [Candidatus Peregrinibacteria bacterium CG11_big_fil_rev_8_21_14_0_20_41_10]|nr:MAG: hypothetical protein COV81_03370 [Candidatus Peregrinibacteria bacterium CG11_big_fil_rev_8_21_14_0_20_41_10]PIZ75796.1 MAG: hypothetical protein COY06_02645 [Candidatus Peregrinibacteria bacterium CG_4_10_14_0_2_um_filter_41_8]PJC38449.1 MAG: hypothetical protein CO045_00390 [Candidatus Peregrinibacteria bacterium CG_4_9_14_0_2_um_filter_41_14]